MLIEDTLYEIFEYLPYISKRKLATTNNAIEKIFNEYFKTKGTKILVYKLNYGYLKTFWNTTSPDLYNLTINNIAKYKSRNDFICTLIRDVYWGFYDKDILVMGNRINQLEYLEKTLNLVDLDYKSYSETDFTQYDIIILVTPLNRSMAIAKFKHKLIIDFKDELTILNDRFEHRYSLYQKKNFELEEYDAVNLNKF
jgi:hypothetical protein